MLYDKLKNHEANGAYPMHMPGHKRSPGFMPGGLPFGIDITEIHGFDDLHDMSGVLLETSEIAARLYGSREAFMLVNGSTAGILAAIGAHTKRGDKILADAGCHRSIPNASELFDLKLLYITPEADGKSGIAGSVAPESVASALRSDSGIKLVVITSPTYEGVVSDIPAIADIAHNAGALLLVDCAHGAHLGFSREFPESPVSLGADIVVMSLHKTLPALTQCSLLHICSGRADAAATRRMLSILQTSSPSYVLMASIDSCLRLLMTDTEGLFVVYERNLAYFHNRVSGLKHLCILGKEPCFFDFDPGRIVIVTKNASLSGTALSEILRDKYNIELEKAGEHYAIAITSICDTRYGFTRLADALSEIDKL